MFKKFLVLTSLFFLSMTAFAAVESYKIPRDVNGLNPGGISTVGATFSTYRTGSVTAVSTYPSMIYGVILGTGTANVGLQLYDSSSTATVTLNQASVTLKACPGLVVTTATSPTVYTFPVPIICTNGIVAACESSTMDFTILWRYRVLNNR
jgi:hypothetical protein